MDSTIAAISTPYGKGGVAMIRISGENAVQTAAKMLKLSRPFELVESNHAVHCEILHDNDVIDDGIAVIYRAPHSYTGEDTVEITCHGGILLSRLVLESAFSSGAVPAQAGEFTKRAFINGKLGLTRAEAVIDLIDAETTDKIKLSSAQTRGVLSRKLGSIYDKLKALVSSIYVYIDFPDEDLADVSIEEMTSELKSVLAEIEKLISSYRSGKAISEGIVTVIAGKPNTGKSSLLNMLAGEERAIVTDIAGTTRDTIEETVSAGRVMLRLCDTAGIHNSTDAVERIGVKRALSKLDEAELVLAVFDGSKELDEEDRHFISHLENLRNVIIVINKSDLENKISRENFAADRNHIVEISAMTGDGHDALINTIESLYIDGEIDYDNNAVVSNARQYAALNRSRSLIRNAIETLENGLTQDIAGLDLESAMSELGEVDGRAVGIDIVDSIFHRFCVGK